MKGKDWWSEQREVLARVQGGRREEREGRKEYTVYIWKHSGSETGYIHIAAAALSLSLSLSDSDLAAAPGGVGVWMVWMWMVCIAFRVSEMCLNFQALTEQDHCFRHMLASKPCSGQITKKDSGG